MSRAAVSTIARLPDETLGLLTGLSGLGAGFLWLWVLILEWPALTAGPLCAESVGIFGHCPLCYPAAASTALFVAGGLLMARRRRRRLG